MRRALSYHVRLHIRHNASHLRPDLTWLTVTPYTSALCKCCSSAAHSAAPSRSHWPRRMRANCAASSSKTLSERRHTCLGCSAGDGIVQQHVWAVPQCATVCHSVPPVCGYTVAAHCCWYARGWVGLVTCGGAGGRVCGWQRARVPVCLSVRVSR
jgi:hypothetical protein